MNCRQCGEPAVYRVHLPYGCFLFAETEQYLCAHHLNRLDDIPHTVLEELR